jgi:hypothetical protein
MQRVERLLGNDREIRGCTTAVATLWPQQTRTQQEKNCWKRGFLCSPCRGVMSRTNLELS